MPGRGVPTVWVSGQSGASGGGRGQEHVGPIGRPAAAAALGGWPVAAALGGGDAVGLGGGVFPGGGPAAAALGGGAAALGGGPAAAAALGGGAAVGLGGGPPAAGPKDVSERHRPYVLSFEQKIGLSLADNMHDAAGGYRNRADPQGGAVRAALQAVFNRVAEINPGRVAAQCQAAINDCVQGTLNDRVLPSDIEDSTTAYFEDNTDGYLQRPSPDAKKTYEELDAIGVEADVEHTAHELRQQYDTYRLLPGAATIKSIVSGNPGLKNKITAFIIKFLCGENDRPVYMTFDAAPKSVGKLFRGHPTVRGLVIPQNIGDSATTSFKQLGAEPDRYEFPFLRTLDQNNAIEGAVNAAEGSAAKIAARTAEEAAVPVNKSVFYVQRNVLSKDLLRMFYRNLGFSAKFPQKFTFGFETAGAHAEMSYEEGPYTQGPSLDYLIDLMRKAQEEIGANFSSVKATSACLRIGDLIERVAAIKAAVLSSRGGVFMDIKRGGDQDVADAVLALLYEFFIAAQEFIIVCTIDRMLALLLRLLGIPCIYHFGDELTLYKNRNSDRDVDDAARAAFASQRDQKFIDNYESLITMYRTPANVSNLHHFICSFRPHIAELAAGAHPIEKLRRNRFVDMVNHLLRLHTAVGANAGIPIPPITASEEDLDAHGAEVEATKRAMTGYLDALREGSSGPPDAEGNPTIAGADMKFLISLKPILEAPTEFDPRLDYGFLNYSADMYDDLVRAFREFMLVKGRAKALREPENYDTMLNKEDGYNTLLKAYTNTFFDKAHGEIARETLLIKVQPIDPLDIGVLAAKQAAFPHVRVAVISAITAAFPGITQEVIAAAIDTDDAPGGVAPAQFWTTVSSALDNAIITAAAAAAPPQEVVTAASAVYRELIARYESESIRIASLVGTTPGILAEKRAFKALKDNAAVASQRLRGIFNLSADIAQLPANAIPAPCPQGGGARIQRGGAYSAEHVALFKDICERAATFINTKIGEKLPGAVQRYAAEQFIRAVDRYRELPTPARASYLNESYMFVANQIPASDLRTAIERLMTAIRSGNIADISASYHVLPGQIDTAYQTVYFEDLDNLISVIPSGPASELLTELYVKWVGGTVHDADDLSLTAISVLLDPYDDVATPDPPALSGLAAVNARSAYDQIKPNDGPTIRSSALKIGYPLLMLSGAGPIQASPVRSHFLKKLLGSDRILGICTRITAYSLIALTLFDDLFKGNVGNKSSLLMSRMGGIPAIARGFDLTGVAGGLWSRLPDIISNILVMINNGRIANETFRLLGGARRTRRRRRVQRRTLRS